MEDRKYYEKKLDSLLQEIKIKLSELEEKSHELKDKAKSGLHDVEEKIKSLKFQKDILDQKIEQLKTSGEKSWDIIVSDFDDFIKIIKADKNSFSEKAGNWINDFTKKVEEFEDKATDASSDLKSKLKDQIENIKAHTHTIEKKVVEFTDSQDENWQIIKNDLDKSLTKLKSGIQSVFEKLKNKG